MRPIDTIFGAHVAVLGKTGSGKTYAAKGIVEQWLDDKRQVCVLDPTGAWWGLRLRANGKPSDYRIVILGGERADIPLPDRSGAAVARLVTEQHANVVVDTSGFTVSEYTRWFTDFAQTLYSTIRSPLQLVIDEAHQFMPQGKVPDPQAGRMLHAGNRLVSGGRSRGIRVTLITQRPQKLHKDSLTCIDTLVVMWVMAPQDRDAVEGWIDAAADPAMGKRVLDSLAQLKRGQGWVWCPEHGHLKQHDFPAIKTFDSSATPTGKGRKVVELGDINLDEVKRAMAEAVREAEANDPKLLRAKIVTLESQLRGTKSRADEESLRIALAMNDREWEAKLRDLERASQGYLGRLRKIGELAHLNGEAKAPDHIARQRNMVEPREPKRIFTRLETTKVSAMRTGGKARILAALAQHPDGLSDRAIGILAGLSSRSGTFATYLAACRAGGLIEGDRGKLRLTAHGISETTHIEPLPTGQALQEYWARELGGGGLGRMFTALCDAHPNGMNRDALGVAARLSAASGTFATYLAKLRTLRLVTGDSELRAADELFG